MARGVVVAPDTAVHRLSRRFLEPAQDVLMLGLGLALFGVMGRTLAGLIRGLLAPTLDFRAVVAEVLFMLVMVELVRLLMVYLEEHRVAVDFMEWSISAGSKSPPSTPFSWRSGSCSGSVTCESGAVRR